MSNPDFCVDDDAKKDRQEKRRNTLYYLRSAAECAHDVGIDLQTYLTLAHDQYDIVRVEHKFTHAE